jgi:lysozyme
VILSKPGIDFIKNGWEKFSAIPYDDGYGFMTIAWGHLIKPGESFPRPLTLAQGDSIFFTDVSNAVRTVNRAVKVPLTQHQFDALVSLCFNIGGPRFWDSTLLKLLNARDYEGAAAQFPLWRKSGGEVSAGLVSRRREETELFLTGDYSIRGSNTPP